MGSPAGVRIGGDLQQIVHSEDKTRYVSVACNNANAAFNGFANVVDVFGYNYKPLRYGAAREANPAKGIYGCETASRISSRGEYTFSCFRGLRTCPSTCHQRRGRRSRTRG